MFEKDNFEILKFDHSFVFFCLHLLFPKNNFIKKYYNNISLSWAPTFFLYQSTFFASPTSKPVGPCEWIMYASKHVF